MSKHFLTSLEYTLTPPNLDSAKGMLSRHGCVS